MFPLDRILLNDEGRDLWPTLHKGVIKMFLFHILGFLKSSIFIWLELNHRIQS